MRRATRPYEHVSIPFRGFHGDNAVSNEGRMEVWVSIPFRGFHGDNELVRGQPFPYAVSIPFRGFHGDNHAQLCAWALRTVFQSPFGDSMGITEEAARVHAELVFQSPFGDSMGITHAELVEWALRTCFNPLSGIPWG